MSSKKEYLNKEMVKDYFNKKKDTKRVFSGPPKNYPSKPLIKDRILNKDKIFKVQREVVDVLQGLFEGETKVTTHINGCKIVGYKIKSQKLVRVDIYE